MNRHERRSYQKQLKKITSNTHYTHKSINEVGLQFNEHGFVENSREITKVMTLWELYVANLFSRKMKFNRAIKFDYYYQELSERMKKTNLWNGFNTRVVISPVMKHRHAKGDLLDEKNYHIRCEMITSPELGDLFRVQWDVHPKFFDSFETINLDFLKEKKEQSKLSEQEVMGSA